ncbi:hypothetical protein KJR66_26895, partial [Klebsiella pneumoniae]
MSLMFAAVTLLTGINLFFIPFQPVPALWGAILAVAFVLINVVADKLRLCRRSCSSTLRVRNSLSGESPALWMPRHSAPICAIGKRERHF